MKKRGTTIVAVLCGLLCAACVFAYTRQVEANAAAERNEALARYGGDQVDVCVATRSIAAGETVDASNVIVRPWLVDLLPESPVTDLSEVSGKQATSSIVAGEVLCQARFSAQSASVSVPSGLQAVGVELNSAQAVGGALQAGAIVDVYAAGSSGTALVAGNVLVASVTDGSSGRVAVTLALPPEHVEEVIATTQTAALYLTLPSNENADPAEDGGRAEDGASSDADDPAGEALADATPAERDDPADGDEAHSAAVASGKTADRSNEQEIQEHDKEGE